MEISHFRGLVELQGIEDPCFNFQWPLNSFDELNSISISSALGESIHPTPVFDLKPPMEKPLKRLKTNSWNSCTTTDNNSHSLLPPYTDSGYPNQVTILKPKEESASSKSSTPGFVCDTFGSSQVQFKSASQGGGGGGNTGTCTASNGNGTRLTPAQDHVLAERKRREKLNQRFIALSALVPGLKKMDKASVLGDAIKYLKQLQEKMKTLEEQTKKRSTTESVVFVNKYELFADGKNSSSDENFSCGPVEDQLPEIEARFSGKDVLIRVHCEKRAGVIGKTLAEVEKLHLSVINSTGITFANHALDITVIAQMDKEFNMSMKDLVKNLLSSIKQFM